MYPIPDVMTASFNLAQKTWHKPISKLLAVALFASITTAHVTASEIDHVTLTRSTATWKTFGYLTDSQNGFVAGSLDTETVIDRRFETLILENRYLKVTLLPGFGGRILSIIYKPTGHEQLYRSKKGVPFGMQTGAFYYDWMMVYGGIFPTFPDAEHGKTWLKPWHYQVEKQTDQEITVSMSLKDDFQFAAAPKQFKKGSTGIEATYYVTLRADRAAVDARVELRNPDHKIVDYEYWTCTTLAPGSDPEHPAATAGAEIIGPIAAYVTPQWSVNLAAGDEHLDGNRSKFKNLRYFKNWPTMGIAYAAPDMQGGNFWGVINHDNEEGIVRIADNTVTPGLKMWTWGFLPSNQNAAGRAKANPAQPYIELWAGVSDQFFHSAQLPALGEISVHETYAPTVGMSDVTDANERILVNLSLDDNLTNLQFFSLEPANPVHAVLTCGEVFFDAVVRPDPQNGNHLSVKIPEKARCERIRATIATLDGAELIAAVAKRE
jgi:hypothetical protein